MCYSRKNPGQTGDKSVGGHGILSGIKKLGNSRQGSIKKGVGFPQKCSQKTHVEWLGSNHKKNWLLGLVCIILLPDPKIHLKFPKFLGQGMSRLTLLFKFQSKIYSM